MEYISFLIDNPLGLVAVGWLLYNFGQFSIEKDLRDEHDTAFPVWPYIKKYWDNWALNGLVGLAIIAVGSNKFDVSQVGVEWNDLYYLLPGPATEYLLKKYKAWKNKNQD